MNSDYFVEKGSIVRQIWGKSDTILFIFAGASAEFALNKAVDWLYFTGKLPANPIGRLFSTVSYARRIVFANETAALHAINAITEIHTKVETKRGYKIPDWAYRDVLFMLIDYSIRSFELLERKLTLDERTEVFNVFNRVGKGMNLKGLPQNLEEWEKMRFDHMSQNLQYSHFSDDLFKQYRKHLGIIRYKILIETQKLLVPHTVFELLRFKRIFILRPLVTLYKLCRRINIDRILKALILPSKYKNEVMILDNLSTK